MLKEKLQKTSNITVLIFLIGMILVGLYKRHQFKGNYNFITGKVTEITEPGWKSSGDYSVLFEYFVDNKIYRSSENYNYCRGLNMLQVKKLLVGKQFPVVYSTNDPGTALMLLNLKNAKRFSYQLPDSLRLYDSILNCK